MKLIAPIRLFLSEIITDFKMISWKSARSFLAMKAALAAVLALIISWQFHFSQPTWAVWTAFAVVQASRGATITQTFERIIATLMGVFFALLFLHSFDSRLLVLFVLSVLFLTICFYCSAKSKTPFAWVYTPVTFLLVLFSSPGLSAVEINHLGYARASEIIIGSLCALAVTLLFKSPIAAEGLKKNHAALLQSLKKMQSDWFNLYRFNQANPEFQAELKTLLNLAESHITLRRFIKQEKILNPKATEEGDALEQVVFIAQEIISASYFHHQNAAAKIFAHFAEPLTQLQTAITQTLDQLIDFVTDKNQHEKALQKKFRVWQAQRQQLMEKAATFREEKGAEFSAEEMTEWSHFLVRQEELFLIIHDFKQTKKLRPAPVLHSNAWRRLFIFDRYYWEYALKTGLLVMLFPLAALYFHLTGVVMLSAVVAFTLQFDINITRRKLFLMIMGATLGTAAAFLLILFNFMNPWLYVLGIGILAFPLAYIKYGADRINFAGLLSGFTFFTTATGGLAHIENWRSALMLWADVVLAAFFLMLILVWIWPFSDKKISQHYHAQFAWYEEIIQSNLQKCLRHSKQKQASGALLRVELNALRQEIRNFSIFNWSSPLFSKKVQQISPLLYKNYHLLAGIMLATHLMDLSKTDPIILQLAQDVLTTHHTSESLDALMNALNAYSQDARNRFLAGDRIPFAEAIYLLHFIGLFKNLVLCHKKRLEY